VAAVRKAGKGDHDPRQSDAAEAGETPSAQGAMGADQAFGADDTIRADRTPGADGMNGAAEGSGANGTLDAEETPGADDTFDDHEAGGAQDTAEDHKTGGARDTAEDHEAGGAEDTAEDDEAGGAEDAAEDPMRGHPQGSPWGDLTGTVEPDRHADEVITAYPSARPGPAGAIYGVGITVLVTDLDRSIAFYRDILGFFEIDNGDGSAVLASGDTRLVLRSVHGLTSEAGRLIYLNLEVGDIEAVFEVLRAKGVAFVHAPRPVNRGDRLELWSATFRDPDDHNLAITQWRAIR